MQTCLYVLGGALGRRRPWNSVPVPVPLCWHPVSTRVCWGLLAGLQGPRGLRVALTLWLLILQRVGYLAASQCFHEGTDVIMLTTNQIRKVGPDALLPLQ